MAIKLPIKEMRAAGGLLMAFALVSTVLVAFTHFNTRETIAANERLALQERLNEVFPHTLYDNAITEDTLAVTAPEALGSAEPMTVYRARKNGEPTGVIVTTVAPNGYSGAIRMLVGIKADGTLTGVRVLSHKETPGLGDLIETGKSDWILKFTGLSLGNPPAEGWAVKKDGGVFDQFSGATITPRAVVQAVARTLKYFESHRETLLAPAGGEGHGR